MVKKVVSFRICLLYGLVFAPLTLLHAAAPPKKSAEDLVREGNRFVLEGRYKDATAIYKKSYEDYRNPDAAFNLALVYDHCLNLNRKAVLYYNEFLRLMPEYSDKEKVLEWIAAAEQVQTKSEPQKRSSEAVKYILVGSETDSYTNEGNQAVKELKYEMAINKYQRAIVINNSAAACYNMALVYDLDLKFYTRAIYYYQKYLVLDSEAENYEEVAKRIETARQMLKQSTKLAAAVHLFTLRGPQ